MDHGCNYIANQLLLSSLKQWFGRNGIDINESKMRVFCFITQQTPIPLGSSSSLLVVPSCTFFGVRDDAFPIIEIFEKQLLQSETAFSCLFCLEMDIGYFFL